MQATLTLGWKIAAAFMLAMGSLNAMADAPAEPKGVPAASFVSYLAVGLVSPIGLMHAGDGSGRLFIIQQGGAARVVVNGVLQATPLFTLNSATQCRANPGAPLATVGFRSGGERGLLGLAFHPDFATNGHVFVSFSDSNGDVVDDRSSDTYIARFTMADPQANALTAADLATCVAMLRIDQDFWNHNGGGIGFGPDGYLYIGMGDGGSGGDPCRRGQTISSNQLGAHDSNNTGCPADVSFTNSGGNPDSRALLAAMLRIDVDASTPAGTNGLCASANNGSANYAIPPGNPFVGADPASACDEIWAYGLRNPWRWSFDRATGDLFIGDVGQSAVEEISFEPADSSGGLNFGWHLCEGNVGASCNTPGFTAPVITYPRSGGRCSITGGYRYRGPVLAAQGRYFYGDYCSAQIWVSDLTGSTWSAPNLASPFQTMAASITSFGEDETGHLYVVRGSQIWRLQGAETQPPFVAVAIDDQSDAENDSINLDVSANFADPDDDPLDFTATGLPSGLDISPDGIISGSIGFDAAGIHPVTVSASDGFNSASDNFTWTVANTNRPPQLLLPVPPQANAEGDTIELDLGPSFEDPDGDTLAFSATGLPPGLQISVDGILSGVLAAGSAGSYSVAVSADDGFLSASDDFTWTVTGNQPPQQLAPLADQASAEGDVIVLDLSPSFEDPDGDLLAFSATGLPSGLAIGANGLITGTLSFDAFDDYTVTITVSDGDLEITADFGWSVANTNRPPEFIASVGDRNNLEQDVVLFDLAALVIDPDNDPLEFDDASSLPPGLSISPTGLISGTLAGGSAGSYPVAITVSDGADSLSIEFVWQVAEVIGLIFSNGFETQSN